MSEGQKNEQGKEDSSFSIPPIAVGKSSFAWLVTNTGAVGIICWILYHGINNVIPDIHRSFVTELSAERTMFREEMKAQRASEEKKVDALIKSMEGLSKDIERSHTELLNELRRARGVGPKPEEPEEGESRDDGIGNDGARAVSCRSEGGHCRGSRREQQAAGVGCADREL